jgi:beta-phosphoglucomutase
VKPLPTVIQTSIRACLFDMDGVLLDSMALHLASWKEAFSKVGAAVESADFEKEVYLREGQKSEVGIPELADKYGANPAVSVEEILSLKNTSFAKLADGVVPMGKMCELLEWLKSMGIRLALVTGTPRDVAVALVEKWFDGLFDCVVTGSDLARGKPDPLPYTTAAQKLGLMPSECVVIENAPLGVESGVRAKIRVIGFLAHSPLGEEYLLNAGASSVHRSIASLRRELEKVFAKTSAESNLTRKVDSLRAE